MSDTTTEQEVIKNKVGPLELVRQPGNISRVCKILGYSRDSFCRFKELYETEGEEALREISQHKPTVRNRVAPQIEEAILQIAFDRPTWGQVRVSTELRKKKLFTSPGSIRSIWLRHDLQMFRLRLKTLEDKVAQDRLIPTEGQVIPLEKAKEQKEAHGEIETEHPGYVNVFDRFGPVPATPELLKKIAEIGLQRFSVLPPCLSVHTWSSVTAAECVVG